VARISGTCERTRQCHCLRPATRLQRLQKWHRPSISIAMLRYWRLKSSTGVDSRHGTLYRYCAPSVDVACPLQDVVSPAARRGVPAQGPISCTPIPHLWAGSPCSLKWDPILGFCTQFTTSGDRVPLLSAGRTLRRTYNLKKLQVHLVPHVGPYVGLNLLPHVGLQVSAHFR